MIETQTEAMTYELTFWGDCSNTHHEETKQLAIAPRMGLVPEWGGAHPPTFDLAGRSVIDIGGGPVSLLLKCRNRGPFCIVLDPAPYPAWVWQRYKDCGISTWRLPAEEVSDSPHSERVDEAWIYNVLQHVDDPARVIETARICARTLRIFEWIGIDPYPGHPHRLEKDILEEWLGAPGFTAEINENGAVGKAFYGVFAL